MNTTSRQQAIAAAERLLRVDEVLTAIPAHAAGTLSHGLAGTALLHARLSATDPMFAAAAVDHWAEAARHAKSTGDTNPGIYHSTGGVAASLIIGTPYLPDPGPHQAATARAARWLSAQAVEMTEQHRRYLGGGGVGAPWHVYDTITGLAGIGRVLLAAVVSGHLDAEPGLLATLDHLTMIIQARYGARPGWWLAADDHPHGVQVNPSGAANTGMAHGIAGPLALLAQARLAGWTVTGQVDAIRDAGHWLLRWRTNGVAIWPPHITGDELDTGFATPVPGRGDAWCYGIPGISRALTSAGHALGEPQFIEAADLALASLTERPADQWDAEGPTLCHGYAGVLQATAADSVLADRAAAIVTASFDPAHRSAFQHLGDGSPRDNPGFLTGAAGVALTLADHGGVPTRQVPAHWDALLLLS